MTVEAPQERTEARSAHHPARFLQSLKWFAEALAVGAFWQVAALLPADRATSLGQRMMKAMAPRLRRTQRIRRNLRRALPEKSEPEIDELTREVWGSVGQLLAEYAHLKALCIDGAEERVEVVLDWDIQAYRRAGKPVVFVTAHLANWELTAAMAVAMGVPLTVVYTPMRNPFIDRMLQRKRRAVGCDFVTKKAASRRLLRDLQNGTSVGLLVDQRIREGEPVAFFGRDALTSISPARLALKFDCDLVPIQIERTGGARFRVTFHHPVKPDGDAADSQARALQMTRQINERFEAWIRKRPEQWICWKRRWPATARPEKC
jgi:KDO2-lipid IV(A) lauroyltransferase